MKRVFVIHGWQGTPESHWKPWLKRELGARGFEVFMPQMPNPIFPSINEWVDTIRNIVGVVDEDTYFVGHSLGCITVVRYLAGLKEGQKVGGVVLVAGFYSDIGLPEISQFYTNIEEVEKAKQHSNKFVSIVSDNDTSVPLEKAKELNTALDGELIIENEKGHFCEEDGVVELPSALGAILRISKNS